MDDELNELKLEVAVSSFLYLYALLPNPAEKDQA
jgi:hypothetical protein